MDSNTHASAHTIDHVIRSLRNLIGLRHSAWFHAAHSNAHEKACYEGWPQRSARLNRRGSIADID